MRCDYLGKCVQGYSHSIKNTECQDSILMRTLDNEAIIVAVADGHGSNSCPYSKTGSKIAVNSFFNILKDLYLNNKGNLDFLFSLLNREGDTKIAQSIDNEWKSRVFNLHRRNKREIPKFENGDIDKSKIYRLYGTTLIGVIITPKFYFALQVGDGDIISVSENGIKRVLDTERFLGIETYSLSDFNSWGRALTAVGKINVNNLPQLLMLSTDGFSNSFINENEYQKTCIEYFATINQYGARVINLNLKNWLLETSQKGCGDDITLSMCYFSK